ncbi:MAG: MFS family permease [Oleispira sp.]|jgi:MFS family permease
MKHRTERLIIGSVFPLVLSCSVIVVFFMLGKDNLKVLPEALGTVFFFGFIIMGLPAFIASIVAESMSQRVANDNEFYKIGGVVGFICGLLPCLISSNILFGLLYSIFGFFVGISTALVLRWHFNKYTANQQFHRTP